MPGSNNDEIKFGIFNEEIEILKKDSRNVEKGHTRRLKTVIRSQDQPTILLAKKGEVKERVTFVDVKEIRSGTSTDLIQLVCLNGEHVMLRVKSSGDSRGRWLAFLKTCLPERSISVNPQRERSSTMDQDLRGQQSRTWRRNLQTQSEYNPDVTFLERPIPNVLDSLPEDEYEVLRFPQPLRSMEQSSSQDDDTASAPGSYNINYNINIRISEPTPAPSSTTPTPPLRVGSNVSRPQRSASTSHHCHISNVRNDLVTELKSVVGEIITGQNEPTVPTPTERSQRPSLLTAHQETEGEEETIYDNENACLRSGTAAVARRNRPIPAVRQQDHLRSSEIEKQTTLSADSSSSDEDDKKPYVNVETNVYLRNLRQDLRDEMGKESVSRTVSKLILLDLQITDTSSGPCISCVPAGVDRLFYHGDRIIGINEQRIIDARFARAIIKTSKKDKIKVTIKRLVRGHFVELHRQNEGDPLGFSLKNGPEILSIKPGTVFARSANCALVERMAISHINGQYIPLDSNKQHVNMCIRNAGFSFFIILQPVTFMKELMQAN